MATIVRHKKSKKLYVLLGSGFAAYQSSKQGSFMGDLFPDEKSGQYSMLCVTNESGRITWIDSQEVIVESVDGKRVSDIFSTREYEA